MIGYVKCFDKNKTMSFKVSDKKTLSEECKYELKKNKMENLINDDFDSSSSDESDNESDIESLIMNLIMMNLMINLLMNLKIKTIYFNNNKSPIVFVNHALLGFYSC